MRALLEKTRDRTALILATGLGVGFSPYAPGTLGTVWGLLLVWGLKSSDIRLGGQLAAVAVLILIGIPISGRAATLLGSKDPGQVVFDEIAAMPVVFLAVNWNVTIAVAGFLWFRLFDILKPWPVRWFDTWTGGLGIMADDLAAGLYAAAALWLTVRIWEGFL